MGGKYHKLTFIYKYILYILVFLYVVMKLKNPFPY